MTSMLSHVDLYQVLRCHIFTFTFKEMLECFALSYAWGDTFSGKGAPCTPWETIAR
jgi:hypothetical protein